MRKSTDGGQSFLAWTKVVADSIGGVIATYIGRARISSLPTAAYDVTNGKMYVAWTNYKLDVYGNQTFDIKYVRSTVNDTTFSSPQVANDDTTGWQFMPWLGVAPNGKVYLTYYDTRSDPVNNKMLHTYLAISTDQGSTFQTPHSRITSVASDPTCPGEACAKAFDYQGLAVTAGFIYPCWSDFRSQNADPYIARVCPLEAPQNLAAESIKVNNSPTPFRVKLKWRAHSCATAFKVYRKGWGTTEFVNIATVSSPETTYIDMDVTWAPSIGGENPIHYYVTATYSSLESDSSNNVSVNCVVCLGPPEKQARTDLNKPTSFSLSENYPNPFNPYTQINYALPEGSYVSLKVYDVLGREVSSLVNGFEEAGYKEVRFDASGLPSGRYFYRLSTSKFTQVRKMMLIK